MVAVVPPLLSDHPPEVPQRAGLGDRFHYFRGRSGRRYLFSMVPAEDLGDFRNALAILADPTDQGRLAARMIVTLDAYGHPVSDDASWPADLPPGSVCLVHFLADTHQERSAILSDLAITQMSLAA